MLAAAFEHIVFHILCGIAHPCADKADCPRNLKPEHEEGDGSKRTVYGVVAAQLDLEMQIKDLYSLEHRRCKYAGNDDILKLHRCVRHKLVQEHECNRKQKTGRNLEQRLNGVADELEIGQYALEGHEEKADTAGHDDGNR